MKRQFEAAGPLSEKVRCVDCGARGYPGCPWQDRHLAGHSPCPRCGRTLTLRLNGTPRQHTRCPATP